MGSNRPTCPEVRGKQDRDYGCSSQCWLGSVAKSTRAKLTLTCYWSRVGTRANHDFVPNPPLPSQFLYAPKESTPERRLMAAVLADAVAIIQHGPEYPKSGANAPARAIRRVGRRCGRLTPAGRPAVVGEWAEPNCAARFAATRPATRRAADTRPPRRV